MHIDASNQSVKKTKAERVVTTVFGQLLYLLVFQYVPYMT